MTRSVFGLIGASLVLITACAPAHVREYRARELSETTLLTSLEAEPSDSVTALEGLERLAREATIKTVAARAAVRAGDRHRQADRRETAERWWRIATLLDPEGAWAQAGIERLWRSWEVYPAAEREERLRVLRDPALEGMLLYLAAVGHAAAPEGRERGIELCLLQRIRTPRSAYRDDCEDLVLALLGPDDRVRFAEKILLPLPSDDPAAMNSPRFQRIELDLARDLIAFGQTEEAVRRLRRVIDRYPSATLKDDALWLLAELHREGHEPELERVALRTLIENLPHSRFLKKAERRLGEIK